MDQQSPSQIDPKLQEIYQRMMGVTVPISQNPVQVGTPAPNLQNPAFQKQNPNQIVAMKKQSKIFVILLGITTLAFATYVFFFI